MQDTETIDLELPDIGLEFVTQTWVVLGGLLLAISAVPAVLVVFCPLAALFLHLQVSPCDAEMRICRHSSAAELSPDGLPLL